MPRIAAVILAAGKGTRMCSPSTPKVMHLLAGQPLIQHVLNQLNLLPISQRVVVSGHLQETLRDALSHEALTWVTQKPQKGTGEAVQQALPCVDADYFFVLYGDVPLIEAETLRQMIACADPEHLVLLTALLSDPTGYGRIVRDAAGEVECIVEEKDASERIKRIQEVNSGIMLLPTALAKKLLPQLTCQNAQNEYYLTDIVHLALSSGAKINTVHPEDVSSIQGVNDRLQLATLERRYQQHIAAYWMQRGVSFLDPARFDARGDVTIGEETVIDINVILRGQVVIGRGCYIGPQVILDNCQLGDGVEVKAHSVITDATLESGCVVGPMAHLRPGTHLKPGARVGNFVELKKTVLGKGSKINHLSYVGDSDIGQHVNIGAGVITCNYDGVNKHKTIVRDRAFVGSDCQLVAPVTIEEGAFIASGTTVTRTAPAEKLTIGRAKQRTVDGWQPPKKKT